MSEAISVKGLTKSYSRYSFAISGLSADFDRAILAESEEAGYYQAWCGIHVEYSE